jgi:cell wall-associated NlpC family hydrolase
MKEYIFNTDDYITIPYARDGRSFKGCDCYGLLILIYRVELGIELKDYKLASYDDATVAMAMVENYYTQFDEISPEQIKPFDIVSICNNSKTPNHCGVILGKQKFIHSLSGYGCAVSKLKVWNKRIYNFHRFRDIQ